MPIYKPVIRHWGQKLVDIRHSKILQHVKVFVLFLYFQRSKNVFLVRGLDCFFSNWTLETLVSKSTFGIAQNLNLTPYIRTPLLGPFLYENNFIFILAIPQMPWYNCSEMKSYLDFCLKLSAKLDQTVRDLRVMKHRL